jgi:type I restriction enzyme M protein
MADQAQRDRFLGVLVQLGGSAGNDKLREQLRWSKTTYNDVRQALLDAGAIVIGRGRGGSVAIAGERVPSEASAHARDVDRRVRAPRPNTTAANVG